MNYIGIDLGTSAVKLLLMEGSGKILKIVSREYPISFPKPGWSEQNPYDWFTQSMDGLKELLEESDKSQVAGISFGGQMHGLVALDEKDEVIRPAILWNDGRTTEECDYLNRVIGKEKLSSYTANISFTGFTAPKVLWMKKNEPENFARISKIMLPKDYLAYRLSGVHCTDVSDASGTLFFDVKNRTWSREMCDICGIRDEWLPKVFESYEAVGTIRPVQEIMRQPPWEPELWGMGHAIFPLEPAEPFSFPQRNLVWMRIMHCIPLTMRMEPIILWVVCFPLHPATNGGWMRSLEQRITPGSRRILQVWVRIMSFSCLT